MAVWKPRIPENVIQTTVLAGLASKDSWLTTSILQLDDQQFLTDDADTWSQSQVH